MTSWISAVRYIDADHVLATGAGGLVLFWGQDKVATSPVGDLGEGLDLSPDGSFFCASGRQGVTACFTNKPVAPSTFVRPAVPMVGPHGGPVAKVGVSVDGRIQSHVGKTLVVSARGAGAVAAGARGKLLKPFRAGPISGSMEIAVVEVMSTTADTIVLTVLEEKSSVTRNGKRLDQFAPATEVTLALE